MLNLQNTRRVTLRDKQIFLPFCAGEGYSLFTPAKSGVGRENPDKQKAIPDAYSVFFVS